MNKPLSQLELIPSPDKPKASETATSVLAAAGIIIEAEPDDFDWSKPDDSIVVPPRRGIAIYRNRKDEVVIRCQNVDYPGEEDHFAFVTDEALPAVIKALQESLS